MRSADQRRIPNRPFPGPEAPAVSLSHAAAPAPVVAPTPPKLARFEGLPEPSWCSTACIIDSARFIADADGTTFLPPAVLKPRATAPLRKLEPLLGAAPKNDGADDAPNPPIFADGCDCIAPRVAH